MYLIGQKKKRNVKSTEIMKKEIIRINEFIFISYTRRLKGTIRYVSTHSNPCHQNDVQTKHRLCPIFYFNKFLSFGF